MSSDGCVDVAVIGSGCAGLTAAAYLARARITTAVIEGDWFDTTAMPGGQLMTTERAQFVPGWPDGVDGASLMEGMRQQAAGPTVSFIPGTATFAESDDAIGDGVSLVVEGESVRARAAILAVGARPRMLEVPGAHDLLGHGISMCATCDAPLYKGESVSVVGGGDTALEEALNLARLCTSVTLVHRGGRLSAQPALQDAARETANLTVRLRSEIVGVLGDQRVSAIELKTPDGVCTLELAGVFVALGRVPNTDFCKGVVELDDAGYVRTTGTRTSRDNVFAAGECQDRAYRQFATAVGSGCSAALDTIRYLSELG
jgi:thioredoxin reductase (NADPH)